ncbi:MAG TPA: N-acetyltransferase [Pyrinomonadaceae bacterium]|nr:N-acetyltransferase [Pyrinomonadaceae bacterium]
MDNIDIIRIGPELIDDILSIQTECGLSEWTREGYLDELTRPDAVLIAAVVKDVTAGFLAGRAPAGSSVHPSHADLYNIGTRTVFRRKGVGAALLSYFLDICDKRRVVKVWLDVRASNDAAKSFYQRHGFRKTGSRKSFYINPPEDGDVMCRSSGQVNVGQSSQGA